MDQESRDSLGKRVCVAVAKGDIEQLRELLEKGGPADYEGGDGRRGLHIAASVGNAECVKALLEHGADPNGQTSRGELALALAARCGSMTTCAALLDAGADPNAAGADGAFPLLYMAREGKEEAEFFIRRGADSGRALESGWTALHEACADSRIDDEGPSVALALVAAGASLLARAPWAGRVSSVGWTSKTKAELARWGETADRLTPAQLARAAGNEEIAAALEPLELAAREAKALRETTGPTDVKARAERWRSERGEASAEAKPGDVKTTRAL